MNHEAGQGGRARSTLELATPPFVATADGRTFPNPAFRVASDVIGNSSRVNSISLHASNQAGSADRKRPPLQQHQQGRPDLDNRMPVPPAFAVSSQASQHQHRQQSQHNRPNHMNKKKNNKKNKRSQFGGKSKERAGGNSRKKPRVQRSREELLARFASGAPLEDGKRLPSDRSDDRQRFSFVDVNVPSMADSPLGLDGSVDTNNDVKSEGNSSASHRALGADASDSATSSRRASNSRARVRIVENRENQGASKAAQPNNSHGLQMSSMKSNGMFDSKENPASENIGNDDVLAATSDVEVSGRSFVDLMLEPDKTHVIFAIDFSSSMNEEDVKTANGKISRWEAVFECVDLFLTQQLQLQSLSDAISTCLVSIFIFNESSRVILKRVPLTGEGRDIRDALRRTRAELRPKGGTGFSAGFQQADQLARSMEDDKVILVFLSDGRPGDLSSKPPHKPASPMQTTFKRSGVVYPAAGHYIKNMQRRHVDFNLQLICLFNEGVHWLKYLACRYNGTFHNPDLWLDDAAVDPQPCPPKQATEADDIDSEDDEEVEVMKVKSEATIIRERLDKAKAAGEVVSLTTMTTSIRSTFSSISATVTAMRSGPKLQERAVKIKQESVMISYEATRMVLKTDASGVDKFIVFPGEKANARRISVSMNPFAQGGLRNVFRMQQKSEKRQEREQVAKESRHDIKYNERLKFHLETVKCQETASQFARFFNWTILNAKKGRQDEQRVGGAVMEQPQHPHPILSVPRIGVLNAEVYRLKAPSCPGGYRYLAVEKRLEGSYEKWNNNDGFVSQSDSIQCKVAQAFSHFTYERSKKKKMVVDIQGSASCNTCMYTDPQLHSLDKEFGRADRGNVGFTKFLNTHKCNFICQEIGLQPAL